MEDRNRNSFDYKKMSKKNSNPIQYLKNKELIQKIQKKYNQKHSKLINFIFFEIILIILPKANILSEFVIKIKVKTLGKIKF